MPLFDFLCSDCGKVSEIIVASINEKVKCISCGSGNVKKCFRHLHLYPEKQAAECLVWVIPAAVDLHQATQIVQDQAVVAAKYHLKERYSLCSL